MRLHRFLVNNLNSAKFGARIKIHDEDLSRQVRKVMRLSAGDMLILFDGKEKEVEVKLLSWGQDFLEVEIIKERNTPLPRLRIVTLYAALLKQEHFEMLIEKATEVGVSKIVPILTKRTVKLNIRDERLKKIAKEATEQSGRIDVPEINPPIVFEEAVRLGVSSKDEVLFFNVKGESFEAKIGFRGSRSVFIGPEGGWDEEEIDVARKAGFKVVTLGPLTFRGETAGIIASYLAMQ